MPSAHEVEIDHEIQAYAQCVAAQVGKALTGQIAAAVVRLLEDRGQSVRIALAVTLSTDDGGGLIAPELSLRRTETAEKRTLMPFQIGQLDLFTEDLRLGLAAAGRGEE